MVFKLKKAHLTNIPASSLILKDLPRIDYQDAYGIHLSPQYQVAPKDLVILFFESIPRWAQVLIRLRNLLVRGLGLKTTEGVDIPAQLQAYRGEPGQSIALFHTKASSPNEILTGEDDRHLDFRLSFFALPHSDHFEIILATTVQFHGWLGKLYFLPVKPIHKILVKALLKNMVRRLTTKTTSPLSSNS